MTILVISTFGDILGESLIGILIVFAALTLLVFAFLLSAYINKNRSKQRSIKSGTPKDSVKTLDTDKTAAISLALHLYLDSEVHDEESNVITIKRIQRRYSPWSSKIYSINNFQ